MPRLWPFLHFFSRSLRLSNPWNFKVPALMAIPYFLLLAGDTDNATAYTAVGLSLATIIGLAGIAYLSNDLADRNTDERAGKPNATAQFQRWHIVALYLGFGLLALGPWWWFPKTWLSYGLLLAELVLFLVYAFPPLRLKERPVWGIVADATYGHVIPATLAGWTFYQVTGAIYAPITGLLWALAVWQLLLGMRNILFHQLQDAANDRQSGTRTFVTAFGAAKADTVVRLLVPFEVAALL
ncbi:MAG: UbiA family prenyltransferase, partial [Bacteroidota bacterium]